MIGAGAEPRLRRRASPSTPTATCTSATTPSIAWSSSRLTARSSRSGARRAARLASSMRRSGWPSTIRTRCTSSTSSTVGFRSFAPDGTPLGAWGVAGAATWRAAHAVRRGRRGRAGVCCRLRQRPRSGLWHATARRSACLAAAAAGDGQFLRPAGVAVDSDGGLYITDHFNDRVQKFPPKVASRRRWAASPRAARRRSRR